MNTVDYIIENHIATVYLNRPPYNPLNTQLYQELSVFFEERKENPEVRVGIITGKGDRVFAAGADINERKNLSNVERAKMSRVSREAYDKVEALSKPDIAAVKGLALGGECELALACEFRICS